MRLNGFEPIDDSLGSWANRPNIHDKLEVPESVPPIGEITGMDISDRLAQLSIQGFDRTNQDPEGYKSNTEFTRLLGKIDEEGKF